MSPTHRFAALWLSALCVSACAGADATESVSNVEDDLQLSSTTQQLTAAQRKAHVTAIRDVAAGVGLTNGALLGGIAVSETGLVHCWSDATWACKGPASPSCGGGPVIAGSGDGACSIQQGGLGMFQFDAGTYSQTLALYGSDVLTLEGNIAQAVEFVAEKVNQDVAGINTRAEALAWINAIPMVKGDPVTEKWASILACRYNGCCSTSTTCTTRRAKYRDNAIDIYNEFGAAFWGVAPNPGTTCQPVPAEGRIIDQGEPCYLANGNAQFWRPEQTTGGFGGNLDWTMATDKATAANSATWQIVVAEPGTYAVSVHLDGGTFGQSKKAAYQITHQSSAGQVTETVVIDQSSQTGFVMLGEFEFAGVAGEQVMLGDNTGEAGTTMTKLLFDAVQVAPVDDTGGGTDPDIEPNGNGQGQGGCAAAPQHRSALATLPLVLALGWAGRRCRRRS